MGDIKHGSLGELRELCAHREPLPALIRGQREDPPPELLPAALREVAPPELLHALELEPRSGSAYKQLGDVALQLANARPPPVAKRTVTVLYERAVQLLPRRDRAAYFALANAREEEVEELHKTTADPHGDLRREERLRKARQASLRSLRDLVRMGEGAQNPDLWCNIGSALRALGRHKESGHAYLRAAKQAGPLKGLSDGFAAAEAAPPRAMEEWERGFVLNALYGLDGALLQQGKYRRARAVQRRGVALGVWGREDQRPATYRPHLLACAWHSPSAYGDLVAEIEADAKAIRREMFALLRLRASAMGGAVDGAVAGPVSADARREASAWYFDHERIASRPSQWLRRHVGCNLGAIDKGTERTCGAVLRAMAWYYKRVDGDGVEPINMMYMKAMYSILQPGAHVRPHTGPTNERLVISLGLAGLDGATIRVGNETRQWARGRALFFDDSFEHEVWNRGEHPRAVLIVHLHHPQLVRGGTYAAKIASAGATVCDSRAEEARPGHPGGAGELLTMTTEASGRVRAST